MPKKVTRVDGMSPLQALITTRMQEKGMDAPAVEARGVKHATLHRYMNPVHLRQLPRAAVLEALAQALELDVEDVRQAAKDSIGRPEPASWRRTLELFPQGPFDLRVVVSRRDRLPLTDQEFYRGLRLVEDMLGGRDGLTAALEAEAADDHVGDIGPVLREVTFEPVEEMAVAARAGTTERVRREALEADPNQDPPGPDEGA